MRSYEDLSSLVFPHFKVIKPIYKEYQGKKKLYWECLCECGNVFNATKTHIKSGKVKSCGCYQKDYQRQKHLGTGKISIGDTFGLLKVENTTVINNKTMYVCRCECGNTITLSGNNLSEKYSCGCISTNYISETDIKAYSFTHVGKRTNRNTSGCVGVDWCVDKQKWRARIRFNGKNIHLGYFDNKEEAIKARKKAENDLYSKFSGVIDKMRNTNNAFTD